MPPSLPTPQQKIALLEYHRAWRTIVNQRQARKLVPAPLLKQLSLRMKAALATGLDVPALRFERAQVLANVNYKTNGLNFSAQASLPLVRDYDLVKNLIYPQFWTPCIRVFKDVVIPTPPPQPGVDGEATQITETVYPLYPSSTYEMITTLDLDFKVSTDFQRVDYVIVSGNELSIDDGDIIVQTVGDNEDESLILIDKEIQFKSSTPLAKIFAANPAALADNLAAWLTDAQNQCGPAPI